MNSVKKFLIPAGSIGALALVLILATPRTVHAIAAALVQVTNTAANPAITQDLTKFASNQVELVGQIGPGSSNIPGFFHEVRASGQSPNNYQVPAVQSLVVTSADVNSVPAGFADLLENTNGFAVALATWIPAPNLGGPATLHFVYPSGLVLSPNAIPEIAGELPGNASISVSLYGYLTSN